MCDPSSSQMCWPDNWREHLASFRMNRRSALRLVARITIIAAPTRAYLSSRRCFQRPLVSDPFTTSPTLLKRLANREDQEAWVRFVDKYGPLIMRFLASREHDPLEVEEIVQRVCICMMDAISGFTYDRSKGRFRSYLGAVTAHEFIKRQKERKPQTGIDFDTAGPKLEAEWEDAAMSYVLQLAMDRVQPEFTPEIWTAFRRQWLDQCKVEALAKETGRSTNWLYQAKHNVLKRLQEEVERLSDDDSLFKSAPDAEAP